MRAASVFTSLLAPIYEFVYPPICHVCESPLREGEKRICGECWRRIRSVHPGDDLYREMEDRLKASGNVNSLISSFLFEKEGVLQSLIHELKYDGMTSVGVDLGRRLGERVASALDLSSVRGVVAVPLHLVKKRERGYNQSEFICRGICDVTGLTSCHAILTRTRHTQSQTQLNVDERLRNVGDAFAVSRPHRSRVCDGVFLIVDDVITTGATIESCARVLIEEGAKSTIACSVALADRSALP